MYLLSCIFINFTWLVKFVVHRTEPIHFCLYRTCVVVCLSCGIVYSIQCSMRWEQTNLDRALTLPVSSFRLLSWRLLYIYQKYSPYTHNSEGYFKPITTRIIFSDLEFEQEFLENVEDHTFISDLRDSGPNSVKT